MLIEQVAIDNVVSDCLTSATTGRIRIYSLKCTNVVGSASGSIIRCDIRCKNITFHDWYAENVDQMFSAGTAQDFQDVWFDRGELVGNRVAAFTVLTGGTPTKLKFTNNVINSFATPSGADFLLLKNMQDCDISGNTFINTNYDFFPRTFIVLVGALTALFTIGNNSGQVSSPVSR